MRRDEPKKEPTGCPHSARDPRLDRGPVLSGAQVNRVRRWLTGMAICLFVAVIALSITVPRSLAYRGLAEENLALKGQLQHIDDRMSEIDRMLLRLHLYDAQLKALSDAKGDEGGPLTAQAYANSGIAEDDLALERPALTEMPEGDGDLDEDIGEGMRSAEDWAHSIEMRVDTFVLLFRAAEPDLDRLVGSLEDVLALEAAFPSVWPTKGALSSGYGWRRDPFIRSFKFHSGLDIANDYGTAIFAPADGTVVRAEPVNGYGRLVELDHGYGITTLYGHCSSLWARRGQKIKRGQRIASMGSSGRSTGPHLHFELRLNGSPVDPLDYLPDP